MGFFFVVMFFIGLEPGLFRFEFLGLDLGLELGLELGLLCNGQLLRRTTIARRQLPLRSLPLEPTALRVKSDEISIMRAIHNTLPPPRPALSPLGI